MRVIAPLVVLFAVALFVLAMLAIPRILHAAQTTDSTKLNHAHFNATSRQDVRQQEAGLTLMIRRIVAFAIDVAVLVIAALTSITAKVIGVQRVHPQLAFSTGDAPLDTGQRSNHRDAMHWRRQTSHPWGGVAQTITRAPAFPLQR